MNISSILRWTVLCATLACVWMPLASANGGPFVVKYPGGDPAAKGVLARLGPSLMPARESRLRVVGEDLEIDFGSEPYMVPGSATPPLVHVRAAYTIENPTDDVIEIDFGFPILRGIYVDRFSMLPRPDVSVQVGDEHARLTIISNSAIYGIIRKQSRELIEEAVAADRSLSRLTEMVRSSTGKARSGARERLEAYLTGGLEWSDSDARLMAAYAGLDLGEKGFPFDRGPFYWPGNLELMELASDNLGALAAIGERKATQLLALLASRFDADRGSGYEAVFAAWGGDVRERAIDLVTGSIRPREISVSEEKSGTHLYGADPGVYARVDYLDPRASLSEDEGASLRKILKNLPVIFSFAPMNLLHYRARFAPRSTETVTVSYSQYAYQDTRPPASYQLAYVVHPASLWDAFGPINLTVRVPEPARLAVSVPLERTSGVMPGENGTQRVAYEGRIEDKTGELFVAIDARSWRRSLNAEQGSKRVRGSQRKAP